MVWITAASRLTGASVKAIRLYESMGLVRPARHDGYRYFDPTTLETLRCIKLAQSLGFTLKELAQLSLPSGGWAESGFKAAVERRRQDLQVQVDGLQARMLKLDALKQEVQNPHFCQTLATA